MVGRAFVALAVCVLAGAAAGQPPAAAKSAASGPWGRPDWVPSAPEPPRLLPVPAVAAVGDMPKTPPLLAPPAAPAAPAPPVGRPAIELAYVLPPTVPAGQAVAAEIVVTNRGTAPAKQVIVADSLAAEVAVVDASPAPTREADRLSWTFPVLAAQESRTIRLTLKPSMPGPVLRRMAQASYQVDATATVQAAAPDAPQAADCKIQLVVPAVKYVKGLCECKLLVANAGSRPLQGAAVVVELPPGIRFHSASDGGQVVAGQPAVAWVLRSVGPGETCTLQLCGTAMQPGEQKLKAAVTAGRTRQEATGVVQVRGHVDLAMSLTDSADPAEIGQEFAYELKVVNRGSEAAQDVQVAITVPAQVHALSAVGPGTARQEGPTVAFEPIAHLAPGAELTYRITASGVQAGECRVQARARCRQASSPVVVEERTTIYKPGEP